MNLETFGTRDLQDFSRAGEKEWLVTNGLGGFASATAVGANTRRYHGLLFAALRPPAERILLLSKLEERITVRDQEYSLYVNDTAGGPLPGGNHYLQQFKPFPVPSFVYGFEDIIVEKTIFMVHGQNTSVVGYRIVAPEDVTVTVNITPLINCRDYHHMTRRNHWPFNQQAKRDGTRIEAYPGALHLYLSGLGLKYSLGPGYWYEGMRYEEEVRRGEYEWEDHYMPGEF
ncbi:MAG TPA: glycogen debranching enzyme N-terminal domain-containing protein, partial [Bacillota bacterium]|nr:glycogen debranching enzyme N-terminal domain-containing protein [Bacillota bacterium]